MMKVVDGTMNDERSYVLLQDFVYSSLIALLFFIASIIFAADNSGSTLARSAVVREHGHASSFTVSSLTSCPPT